MIWNISYMNVTEFDQNVDMTLLGNISLLGGQAVDSPITWLLPFLEIPFLKGILHSWLTWAHTLAKKQPLKGCFRFSADISIVFLKGSLYWANINPSLWKNTLYLQLTEAPPLKEYFMFRADRDLLPLKGYSTLSTNMGLPLPKSTLYYKLAWA